MLAKVEALTASWIEIGEGRGGPADKLRRSPYGFVD